jgi:hypothetical protein
VPFCCYVAKKENEIVGNINLRFDLDNFLRNAGGHIGYSVHPKHRNLGVASFMLENIGKLLPDYGLKRALITTDNDNFASQKVLVKNGATFINSFKQHETHKMRCWISSWQFSQEKFTQNSTLEKDWLNLNEAVQKSVDFLNSNEALLALEIDPYWPKWRSPWWHLCFLHECGLLHLVNETFLDAFTFKINKHYLPFFPQSECQIPKNKNPYFDIICHCAMFMAANFLFDAHRNPLVEIPWLGEWISKNFLTCGGYNCDEKAYSTSRSPSFVSNAAALEFFARFKSIGETSVNFTHADKIAEWFLARNFKNKLSTGKLADTQFNLDFFPRAYEYNAHRGILAVLEYSVIEKLKTLCSKLSPMSLFLNTFPKLN